MKLRIGCVLPAMLLLAGCATVSGTDYSANNAPTPTVAPPQRVDAVSDALGAKMDTMLASQRLTNSGVTR